MVVLLNTEWFIVGHGLRAYFLETHMIILKDPTEDPIQSTDTHFQRCYTLGHDENGVAQILDLEDNVVAKAD